MSSRAVHGHSPVETRCGRFNARFATFCEPVCDISLRIGATAVQPAHNSCALRPASLLIYAEFDSAVARLRKEMPAAGVYSSRNEWETP
jgi:hypothetical protein